MKRVIHSIVIARSFPYCDLRPPNSFCIVKMSTMAENRISSNNVDRIIKGILDGSIKKVVTLSGAGISCNSGIPDFRSPGGLYATLRPELLTATESQRRMMKGNLTAVVDFSLFRENQFPYLEVRRPFILGTFENFWKATAAHFFIQLLQDKGLLQRHYTQNIDGLDYQLSLPDDKVINMHGTLRKIQCEFCGADFPDHEFREAVQTKVKSIYDPSDSVAPSESINILCKSCNKPGVKPATVLYGRNLPENVWTSIKEDFRDSVDLIIVLGTSLTVSPANTLVMRPQVGTPRLVLNNEVVGEDLGLDYAGDTDAILLKDCDSGVIDLVDRLGWRQDLLQYSERMCEFSQQLLLSATPEERRAVDSANGVPGNSSRL